MTGIDTNPTFTADELQTPGGRARLASAVRLANLDGRMYLAPDGEHTCAALEQLATEGVLVYVEDTGYVAVPGEAFNALIGASGVDGDEESGADEAPEQNTDADDEVTVGGEMETLDEQVKALCQSFAGNTRVLDEIDTLSDAIKALDDACAPNDDELMWGTSVDDAAVQERVAEGLAAINRRLRMLVSLDSVRACVARLGHRMCEPARCYDSEDESDDAAN